ncbi:alpha/beta hydrolase [Curtobacterium sp. VKM Ac-1393]|uniref:alpha/beta hydrolase n=1 Tax=Curtobacterium sp. VKM Ac-1393 TaxID=2783814 RepID=UPI00188D751E|nr:alpha/beta hydrolase-fold protein [Curtobacterium sp. VKM Ac-1393]MBF4607663.1 esterase [Curtobacterium sp. VKM Ac-1393]
MTRSRASTITRRSLLIGGVGIVAAGAAAEAVNLDLLPGRSTMYRVLGLNGTDGTIPDTKPVPSVSGTFVSTARKGRTVGWTIAAPESDSPLPVVVALHGYGDDHASFFGRELGWDRFLAAHIADGGSPFAIASIDGGNRYWHHRADGDDPAAMVVDEFLPRIARRGFDTGRLALAGYSMGGFGALRLGGVLGASRVRAVSAISPALWTSAADTARGAFDDAADFRANTVVGRQGALDGVAVRVDCGNGDGFAPAIHTYVDGFDAPPAGGFEPGAHTHGYWRRLAPQQLAFLGRHLGR